MQADEFNAQISRLRGVYGENSFPSERVKLLWREVSDFSMSWFSQVIDRVIGESHFPPMISKFREEASAERERIWKIRKQQNSDDARSFWSGTYENEDIRIICAKIQGRIHKSVDDREWRGFVKHLQETKANCAL